jgi:sulfur-carrier protein
VVNVVVRIPTPLRSYVAGAAKVDVPLADGATISDLLDQLGQDWPALERRIRDEQRVVRQHVNVFIGADNVRDLAEQATTLTDGAEVSVIGAISGG